MVKHNKSKQEVRGELLAFFTQGLFVSAFIFPSMYGVYRVWLAVTGTKSDDAISVPAALLLGLIILVGMAVSGSVGELLWVIVMRSFLGRPEIEKWLNRGITSPSIEKWNKKLLDWAYEPPS